MTHSKRTHHAGATEETKTIATGKGNQDTAEVVVNDASFPQLPVLESSPKKQTKKDEKQHASPRTPKKKDETPFSPRAHKHHKKDDDATRNEVQKTEDVVTEGPERKETVLTEDPATHASTQEDVTDRTDTGPVKDAAVEDKETEAEDKETEADDEDAAQPVPSTYTAMTVDRAAIQGSGDPAEPGAIANQVDGVPNVQAVAYDQQDGITKATNVTLPPGSLPDIVPGVPNVPLTSLLGTNTTQDLGSIPLPDIIPGVPNVPAIVVTNPDAEPPRTDGNAANATAQIQPSDVELKQLPRFAQQ